MALVNGSLRPFARSGYELQIILNLSDLPHDVPLPSKAKIRTLGDTPLPISYFLFFKPDHTMHAVVGFFDIPYSIADTAQWYHHHILKQAGWTEKEKSLTHPKYYHPEQNVNVVLSLSWHHWLEQTQAIIRRGNTLPWPTNAPADYTERFDHALWPFVRGKNWLRLEIPPHLWPDYLPLPATLQHTTAPHSPYWHFEFKPDCTIETVGGTFNLSNNTQTPLLQIQANLKQAGWLIKTAPATLKQAFIYHHPLKGGDLSLSYQTSTPQNTQPHLSITWVRNHPL